MAPKIGVLQLTKRMKVCKHGHDVSFPEARNKSGQCIVCLRKYQAAYKRANRDKWTPYDAKYHRKAKYGITELDYARMFVEQNGVCAICKETDPKKALSVDHDHATGKVRALLCTKCNLALGKVNDNIALLEAMIDYLKEHRNDTVVNS
jgi:hypothetical protein